MHNPCTRFSQIFRPDYIYAMRHVGVIFGESEFGIRFDDPEIGIDWRIPADKIITSDKDRIAKGLKDVPDNR